MRQLALTALLLTAWTPAAFADELSHEEAASESSSDKPNAHGWIIKSEGHHTRPMQFDISLGIWYGGVGVAAWYDIPLVHDGFIPRVNDSFDLEFGLAFGLDFWGVYTGYFGYTGGVGLDLMPLVGVRWNFFLTPDWTVFATFKLGAELHFNPFFPFVGIAGGVGALYTLTPGMHLRLEAGYPLPLSVGLAWDI